MVQSQNTLQVGIKRMRRSSMKTFKMEIILKQYIKLALLILLNCT